MSPYHSPDFEDEMICGLLSIREVLVVDLGHQATSRVLKLIDEALLRAHAAKRQRATVPRAQKVELESTPAVKRAQGRSIREPLKIAK